MQYRKKNDTLARESGAKNNYNAFLDTKSSQNNEEGEV